MEINFEEGYVEFNCIRVSINKLMRVGIIDFIFKDIKIQFVYLEGDDCCFGYSDATSYAKLLKTIAGSPKEVGAKLRQYQNDYGVERELWSQLLSCTFEKYNINEYSYIGDCGAPCAFDYDYDTWLNPQKVDDTKEAYDILNSVLPQNYEETKKKYLKYKMECSLKVFTDIVGVDFADKEKYLNHLEACNVNNVDKWKESKERLQTFQEEIQESGKTGILESKYCNDIQWFLDYCMNYVCGRINKLNTNSLFQQYGPTGELKKSLRGSLNRLGFMELLELFKEYKEKEKILMSKARCAGMKPSEEPYKAYIDIYRLGSVLISDKMNQINRNKAKNKYIPQELLDEAMIFYYDTNSVQEACSVRSNEKYSQDKESGKKGEQKVEYALKWLDKSYIQIEKKSSDRIGDSCIYILNPEFIDEKQEYDHLIVSAKGIFSIETKNYTGKLTIDQYGNWIRKKNDEEEGIKNPLQQVRQHEKILMSFLPKECPVISIICIANDKAIIDGSENCPIPIVKSDMLVEFIENWNENEEELTSSQIEQYVQAIYKHMV